MSESQLTDVLVAFVGSTDAMSCILLPTLKADIGILHLNVTPVTGTVETVITDVAAKPPSCVVAVIAAVPAATAVTIPLESTVTTGGLSEVHLTVLSVAFIGNTVGINSFLLPIPKCAVVGDSDTPVTEIAGLCSIG